MKIVKPGRRGRCPGCGDEFSLMNKREYIRFHSPCRENLKPLPPWRHVVAKFDVTGWTQDAVDQLTTEIQSLYADAVIDFGRPDSQEIESFEKRRHRRQKVR